ncbi:MAG: hypothetical protein MUF07_10690 [Steroidobacteraceae bacterium]|nr:hypothetical protein [Steroidobacteraceae bacterium]
MERPRDVYLAACETIAQNFVGIGFRYSRSAPRLRRKYGDISHTIEFASSHYNIAGLHVVLHAYAWVQSAQISEWRRATASPRVQRKFLAGGMVHLLTTDLGMIEWELAGPADREEAVSDAANFLREVVVPYLDRFRSPEAVLEVIAQGGAPQFDLASMAEYALSAGRKELAQAVLDRALSDNPKLVAMVEEAERVGIHHPAGPSTLAEQIVDLRRAHQLR